MVEHVQKQYLSPAAMKLAGAARHFRSLESELADWTEKNPLLAPTRPVPGEANTYELFMPDQPQVPLLDWSSRFGDAVHNLRAALDLLTFELCHLEGIGPEKPKRVSFPVLDDEEKWDDQVKPLSSIPGSLLQRIADVQPWHAKYPDAHVLTLITGLDNMDKHRTTVGLLNMPGNLDPPRLHPLPPGATNEMWRDPWMRLTLNGDSVLNEVSWPALWHVEPNPMVFFEDRMTFMVPLQRWLYQETDRIFKYVISGSWPDGYTWGPPEWVTVPTAPTVG